MYRFARKRNAPTAQASRRSRAWHEVGTAVLAACEQLEERVLFNAGGGWTGGGIVGTYYSNTNYTGTSFQRTDVRIDFTTGTELPGGSLQSDPTFGAVNPANGFSVDWTGSLIPKYTENYTLKIYGTSNDANTLIINGATIATGSGNLSATYNFISGDTYSVALDYVHSASATWQEQLHWFSNGSQLFSEEAIEPVTPVGANLPSPEADVAGGYADAALGAQYSNSPAYIWGNITQGSTTDTNVTVVGSVAQGDLLQGYGIAPGTTIASLTEVTQTTGTTAAVTVTGMTLSQPATWTGFTEPGIVDTHEPALDANGQPTGDFFLQAITSSVDSLTTFTVNFGGAATIWTNGASTLPSGEIGEMLFEGHNAGLSGYKANLTSGSSVVTNVNPIGDNLNINLFIGETLTGSSLATGTTITQVNFPGNITNGSSVVTGVSNTSYLTVGEAVSGDGISSGTTISSINGSTIVLSNNASKSEQSMLTMGGSTTIFLSQAALGTVSSDTLTGTDVINGNTYYPYGEEYYTNGRPTIPIADLTWDSTTGTGFNPATTMTTAILQIGPGAYQNIAFASTDRGGYGAPGGPTAATSPGITNLSIMAPTTSGGTVDYAPGTIFTSAYLQDFSSYTVLRSNASAWSLDQNDANQEVTDPLAGTDWNTRAQPTPWSFTANNNFGYNAQTGNDNGGSAPPPWEEEILWANETGKDLYINIPGSASGMDPSQDPNVTSSYIYQLAELLKNGDTIDGVHYPGLLPNLNVYIEYGNELWNTSGPNTGVLSDFASARSLYLANPSSDPDFAEFLSIPGAWADYSEPVSLSSSYNDIGIYNNENFTGDLTNGSTIVTEISSWSNISVGQLIQGSGIPAGTTIAALNKQTGTITLSAAATASSGTVATAISAGTTFSATGGIDGAGDAISAALLGGQFGGTAQSADTVTAAGQTITTAQGQYTDLDVYALSVNGDQSDQTFVVNYTNGSSTTYTQTVSSWSDPLAPYAFTGNTTSGSTTITGATDLSNLFDNELVGGNGIPNGTTIVAFSTSTNTVTLSAAATGTSTTGATLTVYPYTGNASSGSTTITNLTQTTGLFVGETITGANLPANTTISSITTGTIVVSHPATATGIMGIGDGESVAKTMAYYNSYTGTTVSGYRFIYSYDLKLNSNYTIASITIPNNSSLRILSMTLQGTNSLSPGTPGNFDQALWDLIRVKDISDIFRDVDGNSVMPETSPGVVNPDPRIRPLFEWQATGSGGGGFGGLGSAPTDLQNMQSYFSQSANGGVNDNYWLYGGGSGWYADDNDQSTSVATLLSDAPGYINGSLNITANVQFDAALCQSYGLEDVAYEGGFDFGNGGNGATPTQRQADLNASMSTLVADTLDQFYAAGGGLPIVYDALDDTGADEWPVINNIYQGVSPKLQGYINVEQSLPPETIAEKYLVAGQWPLSDDSGTIATDTSTNANNATLKGNATWTTNSVVGDGAVNTGSTGYIGTTSAAGLPAGSEARTISFWFNSSELNNSSSNEWFYLAGYGSSTSNQWFDVYLNHEGSSWYPFPGNTGISNDAQTLTTDAWNFLTLTYSGGNDIDTLYLNGQEISSGNAGAVLNNLTENGVVNIGNSGTPGIYDDFRVYTKALSAAQAAFLYAKSTLTTTASTGSVALNWSPVAGATSYDIFRSTSATGVDATPYVTGVTTTTYTDTAVTGGLTYYYMVAPVDTTLVGSSSTPVGAAPLALTPVGEWPLNAGSGTIATDTSGNGENGTIYNGTWTTAARVGGAALDLSASGAYVSASDSDLPNGTASRSMTLWINTTDLANASGNYFNVASYGSSTYNQWWGLYINKNSGNGELTIFGTNTSVDGTIALLPDAWNCIGMVYNGTTNTDTLYVNGQQDTSGSAGAILSNLTSGTLNIDTGGSYHTPAVFDDLRVYNTALTAGEMAVIAGPTANATVGNNSVTVSWPAVSSATTYEVFRSTTPGGENYGAPIYTGTSTSFTDTTVTNGTAYYYTVEAGDTVGMGTPSPEIQATPTTPVTPTNEWSLNGTLNAMSGGVNMGLYNGGSVAYATSAPTATTYPESASLDVTGGASGVGALQAATGLNLSSSTNYSMSIWINTSSAEYNGGAELMEIGKYYSAGGDISLRFAQSGYLELDEDVNGTEAYFGAASASLPAAGNWVNIVASVNNSSGTAAIYVDGQLFASSTSNGIHSGTWQAISITNAPVTLGYRYAASYAGDDYVGLLSDPQIYNSALSQTAANTIFSDGEY